VLGQAELPNQLIRAIRQVAARSGAAQHDELSRIERRAGKQHVVDHRQVREQLRNLKRAGNSACRTLVGPQRGDIGAEQLNTPPGRLQLPADHVEQRGLPRTVRSDERTSLPRLDDQTDVVYRLEAAEMPGDVVECECR
jgi:hypothetical protein